MTRQYKPEQVELQSHLLRDFHRLMLEALRQREQDVFRYIAILAPTLGGYIWLLRLDLATESDIFVVGTLGVIFLLLIGAVYAVALGYNYRYITLQLAKLENLIDIRHFILAGWPRDVKVFGKKYGKWCSPPEVINVFWLAFLVAIAGVTVSAAFHIKPLPCFIIIAGLLADIVALFSPAYFGCKIKQKCDEEPLEWKPIEIGWSGNTANNGEQHDSR